MVIICFERSKILDYPVYLHSKTYIKLRLASQGAKLLTSIDGQDNHNNIPSSGLSKVLVASNVGSYIKLGGQVVMCVCGGDTAKIWSPPSAPLSPTSLVGR